MVQDVWSRAEHDGARARERRPDASGGAGDSRGMGLGQGRRAQVYVGPVLTAVLAAPNYGFPTARAGSRHVRSYRARERVLLPDAAAEQSCDGGPMRRRTALLTLALTAAITAAPPASASLRDEVRAGQALAEKLEAGTTTCDGLTTDGL